MKQGEETKQKSNSVVDFLHKLTANDKIALSSLVISLVSLTLTAIIGIVISPNASQLDSLLKKQDKLYSKDSELVQNSIDYVNSLKSTNVDLTKLLVKTDAIISYSDSLFKVNLETKQANDSANKFRFIA